MGSPAPSSVTAPATMTIKPAAGPLIVSGALPSKLAMMPPAIAVRTPATGGAPLASAMPKLSGSAMRKTKKPEMAFLRRSAAFIGVSNHKQVSGQPEPWLNAQEGARKHG